MPSDFLRFKGLLLGAFFFWSLQVFSQDWQDPQWLRLLHYNKTWNGYLSEADGSDFFLHPQGKKSPKDELAMLVEKLQSGDVKTVCRFPARIRWLKSKDPHFPIPDANCEMLEAYRKRVAARSIAVVFSSYYLNNPSSGFGHTFIRLGKSARANVSHTSDELLDTGINYGALTNGANAIVYALGGLTGYFPGTYNAIPYYYKVREYNDFESRDLWNYELNLTQDEINYVVDHIWELGQTYFDYYFLTENCSYHVLSIIEAARPSVNLIKYLPSFYTIPSDTLKVLEKEKLLHKITFRPAPSTTFHKLLSQLDKNGKKEVLELVELKKNVIDHSDEKKALIYDTALSLIDYKHAKALLKQEEKAQLFKRPFLVARSKIPVKSPEIDFTEKMSEAPHLGHGSRRLVLGAANREGKHFLDLEWRFAFHDLLDFDLGQPPRTNLEVGKVAIRTNGKDHELRELALVDIMSLGKWDRFTHSPSWKIKIGQWQTRLHRNDLSTQGLQGGYGYSYNFENIAPYILLHGEGAYVSEGLRKIKIGLGGDAGVVLDFSHNLKLNSVLQLRAKPWNDSLWQNELRLSNKKHGVGVYHKSVLIDGEQEMGARYFLYL